MSNNFKYTFGLGNVGSYQISSIPFLSSSLTIPASGSTAKIIEFPNVTRTIIITNTLPTTDPSLPFRFAFSAEGITGDVNNNYVPVAVTQSALFTGGNNNIGGTLILISGSTSASNAALLELSNGTIDAVVIDEIMGRYVISQTADLYQVATEDFGQEKMACFPNGEGAISYAPNFKPSKNGIMVSLTVADTIEATIQRIENIGGNILQPKTKIEAEGRDYFAICTDSEGNKIGIYGK